MELRAGTKIWIAAGVTDMRRGFQGLSAQVQTVLEQQPFSGHVFAFRGRRGDQESRPTRARGLKHLCGYSISRIAWSRPTRARGLKLDRESGFLPFADVAPHQGRPFFQMVISRVVRRMPSMMWPQSKHIAKRLHPFPASLPLGSQSEIQKKNFARDLQEHLGILELLALPAPFRICKVTDSISDAGDRSRLWPPFRINSLQVFKL
jgi:IS66 Orf2 like protein